MYVIFLWTTANVSVIVKQRFCRNPRGIFRTNFRVNLAWDFLVDFLGAFFLGKDGTKKSTPTSTAKFKSEFGNFAAKIHTARLWP